MNMHPPGNVIDRSWLSPLAFAFIISAASAQEPPRRVIAIDNVCAWPNLVQMRDGSFVAVVFN